MVNRGDPGDGLPNRPVIPLVMCGGAGTRLWPASREGLPKQFIRLFGERSTFQNTLLRVSSELFARPIVITNAAYRFLVLEQLAEIDMQADIVLEPLRRDSAPAIAAGAAIARKRSADAIVIALAADHVIDDVDAFVSDCGKALPLADQGRVVTFGIEPQHPATEYGYILPGDPISPGVSAVGRFVEKPDAETAAEYVRKGFLWNSGNFVFKAETLLAEYAAADPESAAAIAGAVSNASSDLGFVVLDKAAFEKATPQSIDYAVMEKLTGAAVVKASFNWSDVGSWRAVWELSDKDDCGNAARGPALFDNARNCSVSTDKALVALEGVDDLFVVATADAVLVSSQKEAGGLKPLIAKLRKFAPKIVEEHVKVHRPWGSYESIDAGARHQVKRIVVKPGSRLSLQKHYHRSEHWIVVKGTALVTVNELTSFIHENESTYIPVGATHRLENPGKISLELIEVQTGSYLGEDDIVRIEDDYRR